MALSSATVSCPPLRNEPYYASSLNQQLSNQARIFLRSKNTLQIDSNNSNLVISPIFKWYQKDFLSKYHTDSKFVDAKPVERSVLNFIEIYSPINIKRFMYSKRFNIKYKAYNWNLNKVSNIE